MVRIARLTDYGLVLLTRMAAGPRESIHSGRELAETTGIPAPTVSKVLKTLAQSGLLVSHRGVAGGYSLARPPQSITVAEIIAAMEGPIALTMCAHSPGECAIEASCPDRPGWQRIHEVIRGALENVTLAHMTPAPNFLAWPRAPLPTPDTRTGGP